jgi:hypothetical protein
MEGSCELSRIVSTINIVQLSSYENVPAHFSGWKAQDVAHPNAKEVLCHCATDSKQLPVATPVNEHQQSEAIRSRSTGPFSLANWKCVEITMRYQEWFPSGGILKRMVTLQPQYRYHSRSQNIFHYIKEVLEIQQRTRQSLPPKHSKPSVYLNIFTNPTSTLLKASCI